MSRVDSSEQVEFYRGLEYQTELETFCCQQNQMMEQLKS